MRRGEKEHLTQVAGIEELKLHLKQYPEIEYLYAVPNGGHRHVLTAMKLKLEGVKSGVPDLVLPVARGGYFGFYIEVKIRPNKLSKNQVRWKNFLLAQGYLALTAWDQDQIVKGVLHYLGLPQTLHLNAPLKPLTES